MIQVKYNCFGCISSPKNPYKIISLDLQFWKSFVISYRCDEIQTVNYLTTVYHHTPWNIHRTLRTYYMTSIPSCHHYVMAKQINFEYRMSLFITERAWHVLLFLQCAYAIVCINASLVLVMRGGIGWTGGVYKLAIQPVLCGIPTGDTRRKYQTEYSITCPRERKRWVCVWWTFQHWKSFVKQEWLSDLLTEKKHKSHKLVSEFSGFALFICSLFNDAAVTRTT